VVYVAVTRARRLLGLALPAADRDRVLAHLHRLGVPTELRQPQCPRPGSPPHRQRPDTASACGAQMDAHHPSCSDVPFPSRPASTLAQLATGRHTSA
jgi:hypothetical protein